MTLHVGDRAVPDGCVSLIDYFDDVIGALGVGLLVQDRAGTVLTVNRAAAELLCVPLTELRGANLAQVAWHAMGTGGSRLDPEDRPGRRCIETGVGSVGHVLGLRKPDGELRWIELDVRPLFADGDSAPYAVVSTLRDVTERVAALARVAQASRRHELVLSNSADGYRILDSDGRVIEAYPPIGPDSGFAGSRVQPFDSLPADDLAVMIAMFKEVREHPGATRTNDLLITSNDGGRWFECSMTNYLDAPEVRGIVVNFRDVTVRRDANRRLVFQSRLLDAAGEAIVATDERGRVVFWNQAATRTYGWAEHEALGRFVTEVIEPTGVR